MSTIGDRLRAARVALGMGQSALAREVGISRQALSALEAGAYQPGVAVALKLARVLGQSVEGLFGPEPPQHLSLRLVGGADNPVRAGHRVALAQVGTEAVAVALPPAGLSLCRAGGILVRYEPNRRAQVLSFRSPAEVRATVLVAGCDPAVAILADYLARRIPRMELIGLNHGSHAALRSLAQGEVHAAGVHLRDPGGGQYNLRQVAQVLKGKPTIMVTFARWELGLAHKKNGAISGLADLGWPGVRIVNREAGSGARIALDEELKRIGLKPSAIQGYDRIAAGHLEVAEAVALGLADAGVTNRLAAEVYDLDFSVWREERYDLVMPRAHTDHPPLKAMTEALSSSGLAREVAALCGYDTRDMGRVVDQGPQPHT